MKKIFLKYDKVWGYRIFENAQTKHFRLQDLITFLTGWPKDRLALHKLAAKNNLEWIEVEKCDETKAILFWSRLSFKDQISYDQFKTTEEELAYINAYSIYFDKRWNEIPKLQITFQNYDKILHQWNEIEQEKPKYLIISQNSKNHIELNGKDELSQQDLYDIKLEHEQYLKYEAARKKYIESLPDYSNEWRSSADNEYEADIEKHYED